MNRISYTISLEDFRSRQNGVITSIDDEGVEHYFNKEALLGTSSLVCGNYSMIPSDVELPTDEESSDCEEVIKYLKSIGWDGNVVSHKTLSRWYAFMIGYIRRVNNNGECKNLNIEEITDEERDLFFSLGGYRFIDWLEKNVFPRFNADEEKYEGLECSNMNIFQVSDEYVFLLSCFEDFSGKSETDISIEDCCRYQKYISHGGEELLREIEIWVESLPSWNRKIHESNFESYVSINIPIQTTIEDLGEMDMLADDWANMANYRVGQEDNKSGSTVVVYNGKTWIFSATTVYDKGYYYNDYYKEAYFANPSGMTEIERAYFEQVKDHIFGGKEPVPQWIEYFGLYKDLFRSQDGEITYALKDGKCIFSPTPLKMSVTHDIIHIDEGAIMYNGNVYEIETCSYIIDSDGSKIAVKYENDDVLRPYITIGGVKKYGSLVKFVEGDPLWRFVLTINNTVEMRDYSFQSVGRYSPRQKKKDLGNELQNECKFVIVEDEYIPFDTFEKKLNDTKAESGNENLKLVFNDYTIIDGTITPIIDFEFYHQYMDFLLDKNDITFGVKEATKDVIMNSSSISASKTHGYYFDKKKMTLFTHMPYTVYYASQVEGETRSSLDLFESDMKFFDNLGNELDGLVPRERNGVFKKISALDTIEIPYVVGTVRNVDEIIVDDSELEKIHFVDKIQVEYVGSSATSDSDVIVEEALWPENGLPNVNSFSSIELNRKKIRDKHVKTSSIEIEEELVMEPTSGVNYMIGDILESIEYYYSDSMGNKVVSVLIDNDDFELDGKEITYKFHVRTRNLDVEELSYDDDVYISSDYVHSTNAISYLTEAFYDYKEKLETVPSLEAIIHGCIYGEIYCDFTYYKGATLEQAWNIVDGDTYSITKLFNRGDTAIEYTDTCILQKDTQDFWVNDYLPCSIQYYLLNRPKHTRKISEELSEDVYITKFKSPIVLDGSNNGDMIAAPTFRRENHLGIQDENVVGDIYIDRGICQSIDRHLKLMSCKSIYSLEEYGNNYFNVESE